MISEVLAEWLKSVLLTCTKKREMALYALTQASRLPVFSVVFIYRIVQM